MARESRDALNGSAASTNGRDGGGRGRSVERVLVVSKKSAYEQYVRRHKMARVRALLRAKDPVVANLERADLHHGETLVEVREALEKLGIRGRFRDRSKVGSVDDFDLVIT